jgi:hypothetical protein
MDKGVRILELAQRAGDLFDKQQTAEKRRLLNCVLSTSSWKNGALAVEFRQPFDMLIDASMTVVRRQLFLSVALYDCRRTTVGEKASARAISEPQKKRLSNFATATKDGVTGQLGHRIEDWLPDMDSNVV